MPVPIGYRPTIYKYIYLINRVLEFIPFKVSCLVKSLLIVEMIRKEYGIQLEVELLVFKNSDNKLKAHARHSFLV